MKNNPTTNELRLKNCCEALSRVSYERVGFKNKFKEIKRMDAEDYPKIIIRK